MSEESGECLWGLKEQWCQAVRQEAGVTGRCPSELACSLLKESYETREMNWPEYLGYMKHRLSEKEEQAATPVPAAA